MHHKRRIVQALIGMWLVMPSAQADEKPGVFRAGVSAVSITPENYPVRVNGMFTERAATQTSGGLFARSLALDDGDSKLVLCVADSCMMPAVLIDQAKQLVQNETGLSTTRMMVSATHTHSAPAAMGCLGSRADPAYSEWLPAKLAESMIAALADLQPARIGWGAIDDWEHTHNRRWILRKDRTGTDPFGVPNMHANMHPGHLSKNVIGPSGPVDPELSLLAVQTLDGKPLGLFANYSQHYFGSGLLSADYYGAFCDAVERELEKPSRDSPFVAMISQGTSGDLMWMDYGAPRKNYSLNQYAAGVAAYALKAYAQIEWRDHVPLAVAEQKLTLAWRVPDAERLAWAQARVKALNGELPRGQADIYAWEARYLHEDQKTEFKLQSIRIGELGITTLPNEVYAITGLKLKAQSPLESHFNIELANGAVGYIPPVEQHALGGYTTWPARTAGLEVAAEATIVDALLTGMEEVARRPRRVVEAPPGAYSRAVLDLKPEAYWRLEGLSGTSAPSAVGDQTAALVGKFARYLPGVGSGSGCGEQEALRSSPFSAPGHINRCVQLVDGHLSTTVPAGDQTISLWFWLGEASGASKRSGELVRLPAGNVLGVQQGDDHLASLSLDGKTGPIRMRADEWHLVTLVQRGRELSVFLDGGAKPELAGDLLPANRQDLTIGEGLEGKLDEIAVYPRALKPPEIASLWKATGLDEQRAAEKARREKAESEAAERANPPAFPESYAKAIEALKPTVHAKLDGKTEGLVTERRVRLSAATYANFEAGRIRGSSRTLGPNYSVSFWFRNEIANHERAVTAYLFSRGTNGDKLAPGDHLGIGGSYQPGLPGKIILFNGNTADELLTGKSVIPPGTWNHALLVREGERARVYLNGAAEIDGRISVTTEAKDFYLGARSDSFAPLHGYLAQFTLFDQALTEADAQKLSKAAGPRVAMKQEPDAVGRDEAKIESPPLSPPEGLKTIRVPEGFTVELVASEPELFDPVAFDWDTRGRLWVVEMADYPLGGNAGGGRVRMLEDRDQDGRYERSTLFADGLNFPNGILTWRDGVIVSAAPEVLFLRDSNGDGKADDREVLISGLTTGNQQLRANGLRWGLDNWVYLAAGGHHGKHGLDTKLTSTRTKRVVAVGSRDFRFRPDTGELEAQSGPSQFGRNRDDWGNWFGTQNSHPLWHYVLPDHYLKRNPYLAAPEGRVQLPGPSNPKVYPASALQKRFHSFDQSGRFTSACAGMIYRDARLFPREELNAFTCEPFHNLVQRIVLEPKGVSFSGRRAGEDDAPDFFASTDRWCRPVMTRTGPDGHLWVADMYRYMIEHPQWLPKNGKEELLPHYRQGEDRGRIYRVRKTTDQPQVVPDLETLDLVQLVGRLGSANGWIRDKAQQLLLWRADARAVPLLVALSKDGEDARARLHALCTLDGLHAVPPDLIVAALADPHPGVRRNALRLAEQQPTPQVQAAAWKLADDPDPTVRFQLAFSLGAFPASPETAEVLAGLITKNADDRFFRTAVLSSAVPHQALLIERLVADKHPALAGLREPLLELAISSKNEDAMVAMVSPAVTEAHTRFTGASLNACIEILDLLASRNRTIATITPNSGSAASRKLATTYAALLAKARASQSVHAAALLTRSSPDRAHAITFLGGRLRPSTPPEELHQVMDVLAGTGDERVAELLIGAWPGLTPDARGRALDVLLARSPWTQQLLAALDRKIIHPSDFDPSRRTRLLNDPDKNLRALAATRLKTGTSSARSKVVEAYRPALKLTGDPNRGKAVFAKACISCHKLGDQGVDLGPDLRSVAAHPPEKLLVNILDPNLDIQPGYHAYQCTLNNGEQLFGMIATENATSITLKMPDGKSRPVLRQDIAKLESLPISLMPEGIEGTIDQQDLADLIAFLKLGA